MGAETQLRLGTARPVYQVRAWRKSLKRDKPRLKAILLKIGPWLEALLLPFGIWGLLGFAFIDSALIPLPTGVNLLLIRLCVRNPQSMVLYGTFATAGSVAGCLILYFVSRAAGHAAAERKVGKERMERIRAWFERHEFLTVMVPAIMPPPTPFKAFIITAGLTEVHLGKFLLALTVGRFIRYFGEGYLAVRYGPRVWDFARGHGLLALAIFSACVLIAILSVLVRQRKRRGRPGNQKIQPGADEHVLGADQA